MKKKDLTPYYIYALSERQAGVFYVGMTNDLTRRYKQHLAGDDNEEKTAFIEFLVADGEAVAVEVLDTAVGRVQAEQLETFWILYYTLGGSYLTNTAPGVLLDIRYLDQAHREKLHTAVSTLAGKEQHAPPVPTAQPINENSPSWTRNFSTFFSDFFGEHRK